MVLCDRLEASLAAGDETRGRLVEAVVHETLATSRPAIQARGCYALLYRESFSSEKSLTYRSYLSRGVCEIP